MRRHCPVASSSRPAATRLVIGSAWLAVGALFALQVQGRPPATVYSPAAATTVVNSGVCDVDGVSVTYTTKYQAAPERGYAVTVARVNSLDPHCSGATVKVTLSNGASVASGDPTRSVVYNPSVGYAAADFRTSPAATPLASWVKHVTVELAGGTLPIPQQCAMPLDRSFLGTTGSDPTSVLTGTNQNDVLFGLNGDDSYAALNGDDCVVAGNGNNTIDLGTGADVVVAGDGSNTIVAGNGAGNDGDYVTVGNGNNVVTFGNNGGNRLVAGTGDNTIRIGSGKSNTLSFAGRSGGLTQITGDNGSYDITVKSGRAIVRLGNADNSTMSLGDGADQVYLGNGKNNTVAPSPGVDTCHVPAAARTKDNLSGCDLVVYP